MQELGLKPHQLWTWIETTAIERRRYPRPWEQTLREVWDGVNTFSNDPDLASLRHEADSYWTRSHGRVIRKMLDDDFQHIQPYLDWLDRMEQEPFHIQRYSYITIVEAILNLSLEGIEQPETLRWVRLFLLLGQAEFKPSVYQEWNRLYHASRLPTLALKTYPTLLQSEFCQQPPWATYDRRLQWFFSFNKYLD